MGANREPDGFLEGFRGLECRGSLNKSVSPKT